MTSTVLPEPSLSLSLPDAGLGDGAVALRMPTADDVVGLRPAPAARGRIDKTLFSLLPGE